MDPEENLRVLFDVFARFRPDECPRDELYFLRRFERKVLHWTKTLEPEEFALPQFGTIVARTEEELRKVVSFSCSFVLSIRCMILRFIGENVRANVFVFVQDKFCHVQS